MSAASRFALLLVCLAAGGCGPATPPTYPVRGRVVFQNGTPLRQGIVQFQGVPDASLATGAIRDDGTFELSTPVGKKQLTGAVAGEHRVLVLLPRGQGPPVRVLRPRVTVEERDNDLVVQVTAVE